MLSLGARIRQARLDRGLSQGDLEGRTGLLRCYLSRVENGHTEPSLQTLARLATALEMPLVGFFDQPNAAHEDAAPSVPQRTLSEAELAFLAEMRQCASALSESDRRQVLALAKKMATAPTPEKAAAATE